MELDTRAARIDREDALEDSSLIRRHHFSCPHCGERISVILDLSTPGPQRYIEDCEVCCNPIEIGFVAEEGVIVSFEAKAA